MPRQLGLPQALAAEGLTVEVVPGWETRGSATFNPKGALVHWTAGPATGDRPSLHICTHGRQDLPGPLCNVFLTRGGVAVVVAAGRANHAGKGVWRGVSGNSHFFGTEAEATGPNDWTDAQRWAYPRINAAYCRLGGFGVDMVCGHHEYALPRGRKVDVGAYISTLRPQVAQLLRGEEDDMTPAQEAKLDQALTILRNLEVVKVPEWNVDSNTDVIWAATLRAAEGASATSRAVLAAVTGAKTVDPQELAKALKDSLGSQWVEDLKDAIGNALLEG